MREEMRDIALIGQAADTDWPTQLECYARSFAAAELRKVEDELKSKYGPWDDAWMIAARAIAELEKPNESK